MSLNGGNEDNYASRMFLQSAAQSLAGLTSPQEQQLMLQRRFAEQQAEEQQRHLQLQQLVAANSSHLALEQSTIQSAIDMLDAYRQRQVQIDRDLYLRNQIMMIEQQLQRHSEVLTPTRQLQQQQQQQQQDLLLSPALVRHRQLLHMELLAAQKEVEVEALQEILQTEEKIRNSQFSTSGEEMMDNRLHVLNNSHNHTPLPRQILSDTNYTEYSPSRPSLHVSTHGTPSAAAASSVSSEYQRISDEERTLAHLEAIAGYLQRVKRKDIDDGLYLDPHSKQTASPQRFQHFMEASSAADDELVKVSHEEKLNQAAILNSIAKENSTKKAAEQRWKDREDSLKGDVKIQATNEADKQRSDESIISEDGYRACDTTRNIAALFETLKKSSPLLYPPDSHIETSSTQGYNSPQTAAISQAENCERAQLEHSEAAEIFQLMQRLKQDDGIELSPGEDDYDDNSLERQSDEDSAGYQHIVEGQSNQDSSRYKFSGNSGTYANVKRSASAPLVLSRDDYWWPNPVSIQKERRARLSSRAERHASDKVLPLAKRLKLDPEQPGLLQKLPYCWIHIKHQQLNGEYPQKALFCTQVAEAHPTDPLVCCSVCFTWRHAACGGHHSWSSSQKTINPKSPFIPLCDQCFQEKDVVAHDDEVTKALRRQRLKHLRKTLVTNQAIRYAAFSKHASRCYKCPLGSVFATHVAGHTKSVNARHEKAEKQWQEMAAKLSNPDSRSHDRFKVRYREFEKLQQHIEDAELCTDRHNMILFLQNDVEREYPVGYEVERRNFFDPLDDPIIEDGKEQQQKCTYRSITTSLIDEEHNESSETLSMCSVSHRETSDIDSSSKQSAAHSIEDSSLLESGNPNGNIALSVDNLNGEEVSLADCREKKEDEKIGVENDSAAEYIEKNQGGEIGLESDSAAEYSEENQDEEVGVGNDSAAEYSGENQDEEIGVRINSVADYREEKQDEAVGELATVRNALSPATCARASCHRKPRYDSIFCSDACGISTLERDLLNSLEYSEEMHPSLLR